MPQQDRDQQDAAAIAGGREVLRQVRDEGREAIREARRAVRDRNRDARQRLQAAARQQRRDEPEVRASDGGTRSRIQHVALELFTENGYEATSLREIAEHLGVTKAALYYHFRTKDEIIESLIDARIEKIGELVDWVKGQPRTVETRRELLRRYSELLHEQDHHQLMRFFERNQSSMGQLKAGATMRERMMAMLDAITEPDSPLTQQVRRSMAIFALHSTWFIVRDPAVGDDERREAALEVALELVE